MENATGAKSPNDLNTPIFHKILLTIFFKVLVVKI